MNCYAVGRRFREAVVVAAENIADLSVLIKTDQEPDTGADIATPFDSIPFEKGMITALPATYDAFQPKPEQPAATYPEFVREQAGEAARPLNMPNNIARADSSGYSFSGGKLDHLTYFVSVDVEQQDIEEDVLDPLFEVWFAEAVLRFGWAVPADPAPNHAWDWPEKPVIDEKKHADANAKNLASGVAVLRRVYAQGGLDFEDELPRMAEDYGKTVDEMRAALFEAHFGNSAPAAPVVQPPKVTPPSPGRNRLPTAASNGNRTPVNRVAAAKKKTIFLDVDGVLNHHPGTTTEGTPDIEQDKARRLNRIIKETGAVLVMITAWRGNYTIGGWEDLLGEHGIQAEVDGILLPGNKKEQLIKWIDHHNVGDYVVVDDRKIHHRQITPDSFVGLTDDEADKVIEMLNATASVSRPASNRNGRARV